MLHRSKRTVDNCTNPVKFNYLLIYCCLNIYTPSTINQTTNKPIKSIAAGVTVVVVIIIIIEIIIILLLLLLLLIVVVVVVVVVVVLGGELVFKVVNIWHTCT